MALDYSNGDLIEYCDECGNPLRTDSIVWQAMLTDSMISDLDGESFAALTHALDEAVMQIASDWGIQ